MQNSIQVRWHHAPFPSEMKTKWHTWTRNDLKQISHDFSGSWQKHLHACFQVVRSALNMSLPRSVGWTTSPDLPAEARLLIRDAARMYKRGVAFHDPCSEETATETLSGQYQIRQTEENSDELTEILTRKMADKAYFTLADQNILRHHVRLNQITHMPLEAKESLKTPETLIRIVECWDKFHQDKETALIIGGGIISDIGAFAASILGKSFILVPSTLLAMVDACIGGKCGINIPPFGKNQAGYFAFPDEVLLAPSLLRTLPEREFRSGSAECLKHAFLNPEASDITTLAGELRQLNPETLAHRLPELIRFKADLVSRDPLDRGERAILNFGHTLGHALEAISHSRVEDQHSIRHGEAVAVGMLFALILSRQTQQLPDHCYNALIQNIYESRILPHPEEVKQYLGMAPDDPHLPDIAWSYMIHDKKSDHNKEDSSRWILLSGPGRIARDQDAWTIPVSYQDFLKAWQTFIHIYLELFLTSSSSKIFSWKT